jgi:anti-sigma-K factor RskA
LPDSLRERMRGLLEPLGFDLARAIAVREPDGEEALEFRQHLETCEECRNELASYERAAAGIGLGVPPVPPPPGLRDNVMAAVGAPVQGPAAVRPRRAFPWLGALATAAAVVLAIALLTTLTQLQRERARAQALAAEAEQARRELAELHQTLAEARSVRDLVIHPDSRLTVLAGLQAAPRARARVIWNASTREAVLIASGLQRAPEGKAYEVWVIAASKAPTPAGVFQSETDGTALVHLPRVEETARPHTFAVTIEPAGGSASPTGPMVLAGAVS